MIIISMEAQKIPDGQVVRKVTGIKEYVLRKNGIKIYASPELPVFGAGKLYLQSQEHIVLIQGPTILAIDFATDDEAVDFLTNLESE